MKLLFKNLNATKYREACDSSGGNHAYYFGGEQNNEVGKVIHSFYSRPITSKKLVDYLGSPRNKKIYEYTSDETFEALYVIEGRCPNDYVGSGDAYLLVAKDESICLPQVSFEVTMAVAAIIYTYEEPWKAIMPMLYYLNTLICNNIMTVNSCYEWTHECLQYHH
ncbi:MAG: hypothetical protein ACHP9Y_01010 [Gammaproteobacteria bacterium]